jgi:hypothetical protein
MPWNAMECPPINPQLGMVYRGILMQQISMAISGTEIPGTYRI